MIIPEENRKDLADIPKNVTESLEIRPVRWIDEVLDIALERPLTSDRAQGEGDNAAARGEERPVRNGRATARDEFNLRAAVSAAALSRAAARFLPYRVMFDSPRNTRRASCCAAYVRTGIKIAPRSRRRQMSGRLRGIEARIQRDFASRDERVSTRSNSMRVAVP